MRINYNRQINKEIDIPKIARIEGKEVKKGQVLKGEILDIKHKNIIIKLLNNATITAKLTDQMEFLIGQEISFKVKESNAEQILLKPIIDENSDPKNNRILQILDEANVPINNKNIEIVEKLINNNMNVDKEFINKVITMTREFKDTNVDRLILLLKNDIKVTKENIKQLDNYITSKNSIKQDIMSLVNNISEDESMNIEAKQKLLDVFTQSNYSKIEINGTDKGFQSEEIIKKLQINNNTLKTNNNVPVKLGDIIPQEKIINLKNKINNSYDLKGNNVLSLTEDITLDKLQEEIFALEIKEEDKKHIMNDVTNKLLKNVVDKNIYLSQDALKNPKLINEYFKDIYNKVVNIIKLTQGIMHEKNNSIMKDAVKIKNNIEFMNDLNNNFNYVQLPFEFNNKLVGSELYIFDNKKSARKKTNANGISALLRLDYVNLGHIDVYVNKVEKNIELKFYVQDNKIKNVIDNHITNLHKKIMNYDYNIMGLTVINNKKDFDFVKDFMKKKNSNNSVKRYTFDMRA